MPRYFFHLVSTDHVLQDDEGIELEELSAAYGYGLKLQHQIRAYAQDLTTDWTVKVSDDEGATPLVILPWPDNDGVAPDSDPLSLASQRGPSEPCQVASDCLPGQRLSSSDRCSSSPRTMSL
jgi:hypothetical protein